MVEFYSEKCKRNIKYAEQSIADYKEHIKAPKKNSLVLWEMLDYLESERATNVFMSNSYCGYCYLQEKLTPAQFDEIIYTLQEIAETNGFTEVETYETNKFRFINKDKLKIDLNIELMNCERIATGKMIPETKPDCSIIKV